MDPDGGQLNQWSFPIWSCLYFFFRFETQATVHFDYLFVLIL